MIGAATALLVATLALGVVVGIFWLGRARRKHLVTLHLVLALAAVQAVVLLLRAAPGRQGPLVLGLLAGSVLLGVLAGPIARRAKGPGEAALAAHVLLGLAGFFVALAWFAALRA